MGKNTDAFVKIAEFLHKIGKHPTLREGALISNSRKITNGNGKPYNSDHPRGFAKAWSEAMKDFDYSKNPNDKGIAKMLKETFVGENGKYVWK